MDDLAAQEGAQADDEAHLPEGLAFVGVVPPRKAIQLKHHQETKMRETHEEEEEEEGKKESVGSAQRVKTRGIQHTLRPPTEPKSSLLPCPLTVTEGM